MEMRKTVLLAMMLFCTTAYSQTFEVVPLGVYGGNHEDNLSSYLIGEYQNNAYLALDGGTINAGIRKAIALKTFNEPASRVLKDYIKGYFISHGHLDHLAGMIINAPADAPKSIYATPGMIDVLKNHYFIDATWANFGNEGTLPIRKYRYIRLYLGEVDSVENTNMTIQAFDLSHVSPMRSSAALVSIAGSSVLYLGDTGADRVEGTKDLEYLWKAIAPIVIAKQLKALMIEVSFPNAQSEKLLFGHLTPALLSEEMEKLAQFTGKEALRELNVVITHMKPEAGQVEEIKRELIEDNPLALNYIFPEQGRRLIF
ncbi:MBL fold metallo-hydrolase [Sphingobacterium sp. SG20118]|uniref:MBL fold metallo-hydrolase n=1 Tax=Sphingobacterium sp. SG20118 TaxID=3367156 RepID=UPI0037DFC49A